MMEAFQLKDFARKKCIGSIPCKFTTYQHHPNKVFESIYPELRITMSSLFEQKDASVSYNFSSLLSEAGGIMGLFLGWSFLSMILYSISFLPKQRFETLLNDMLTIALIIGFFFWSKDLFQSYMNESESFEVQVERVGNELEPPFITVCPVIDVWNYANLTYYPSIPDNLSDYVLCVRLYSSEFFQGLKKCLVTNPDMYSFIFNMDTAYSPQFLPTLTLLSEKEEKALDIGLWKRVFHERYGLCYTLDSKHWKR